MSSGYFGSYTPPVRRIAVQGHELTLADALTELGALDAELRRLAAELRVFGGRSASPPAEIAVPGAEASDREIADALIRLRDEAARVRERAAASRAEAVGARLARSLGEESGVRGVDSVPEPRTAAGSRAAADAEINLRALAECRALVRKEARRIDEADADALADRLARMRDRAATASSADFGRSQLELRMDLHDAIGRRAARHARVAAQERLMARAALAGEDERAALVRQIRGADDPRALEHRVEQAVARAAAERGRADTARQIVTALRAIDCDVHEQAADVLAATGEIVVPLHTEGPAAPGYGVRVRLREGMDLSTGVVDLDPDRPAGKKPGDDVDTQKWFCAHRAPTLRAHLGALSWHPRTEHAPGRHPAAAARPTAFERPEQAAAARAAEEERRRRHQEQARQRRRSR
ncbi:hypothetical protein [Nocardiopsis sp. CC223A]|uniref:hypothetical protein n=1 Tax=Nocardiopsis sp. CC223A TaxID=3044051 RepID=UPI00278C3719|nr:hypothetical protein [Nocardiopsis sp. CC223A]